MTDKKSSWADYFEDNNKPKVLEPRSELELHAEYIFSAIDKVDMAKLESPALHRQLLPKAGDNDIMSKLKVWVSADAKRIVQVLQAFKNVADQLQTGQHALQLELNDLKSNHPDKTEKINILEQDLVNFEAYVKKELLSWERTLSVMEDEKIWQEASKPYLDWEMTSRFLDQEKANLEDILKKTEAEIATLNNEISQMETDPLKKTETSQKRDSVIALMQSKIDYYGKQTTIMDNIIAHLKGREKLQLVNGRALDIYLLQNGLDKKIDFPKEYK